MTDKDIKMRAMPCLPYLSIVKVGLSVDMTEEF